MIDKGVAFPVINESADYNAASSHIDSGALVNGFILRFSPSYRAYYPAFRWTWPNQTEQTSDKIPQIIFSVQPMLIFALRKVLEAVGYPLMDESERMLLSNSLFRHIFIVTANNRIEICKGLPHWTVNDFLTQVENLLGIVIEADEVSKSCSVLSRDEWFAEEPTVINDVVDEFTAEVDKNETTDITNGNIGFADIEDGELHISQDILDVATFDYSFEYIAQMQFYLLNGKAKAEDKSKIFVVQGRHFIMCTEKDENGNVTEYYFKEVNQLRMAQRNPNKTDVDVELKIRPCPITDWTVPYLTTYGYGTYIYDEEAGTVPVKIYTRPDTENIGTDRKNSVATSIDIEALISGDDQLDKSEEQDTMYIGVLPLDLETIKIGDFKAYYPNPVPWPDMTVRVATGSDHSFVQQEFLTLNKMGTFKTLYTEALSGETSVDTTIKYCIKFISHEVLRPTGVFIINNRRFACEKLEYQITAKGVSPLVTGYFYRLDS